MERRDWTLLAIAAGGKDGLSPVQLQKSLFLLGQMCPEDIGPDFYNFEPYDYGPFDADVYSDARELERMALAVISPDALGRWRRYGITALGAECAERSKQSASTRTVEYLEAIIGWAKNLSFSELLGTIYRHFPEYSVNSVFRG